MGLGGGLQGLCYINIYRQIFLPLPFGKEENDSSY